MTQCLMADLWLGRLVVAAGMGAIAAVCMIAVCASPIVYVQTVLSERALDAYMMRALEGVAEFQRTHHRFPDQKELDTISGDTAEGRAALAFEISVSGQTATPSPSDFQLEFEREAETAIVMSSSRSSTIETSWAKIGLGFLPIVLGLSAASVLFGGLAKVAMPSASLRHWPSASPD